MAASTISFFTVFSFRWSISREHERDTRQGHGDGNEDRSEPQTKLHGAVGQWPLARAIGTNLPRSPVYGVEAVAEGGDGERDEVGLVRGQRSEMADPRPAHTEAHEYQRQNAARRSGDRARDT